MVLKASAHEYSAKGCKVIWFTDNLSSSQGLMWHMLLFHDWPGCCAPAKDLAFTLACNANRTVVPWKENKTYSRVCQAVKNIRNYSTPVGADEVWGAALLKRCKLPRTQKDKGLENSLWNDWKGCLLSLEERKGCVITNFQVIRSSNQDHERSWMQQIALKVCNFWSDKAPE